VYNATYTHKLVNFMEIVEKEPKSLEVSTISFKNAIDLKNETIWSKLKDIRVEQAIFHWSDSLQKLTCRNYLSGMNRLVDMGMLDPQASLQQFALMNHEAVLDQIKLVPDWQESTRQARAACYISFTRFLNRRTQRVIERAMPSREGVNKTFYKVREKVTTKAMTQSQWTKFLDALGKINPRDAMIAKVLLQGGKRVSEALQLRSEQIDFENNQICFVQSKTKGMHREIVISYPYEFMVMLRGYIGDREGTIFVTCNGRQVQPTQLERSFYKAGIVAGVPFKVTPHVMRASVVTYLKRQGFSDSEIMKVTGHASSEMVHAYDKSQQADNITQKINLI